MVSSNALAHYDRWKDSTMKNKFIHHTQIGQIVIQYSLLLEGVRGMTKKMILIMALAGMCLPEFMQAQTAQTTAVPFLLIVPDSRASGMGETGVALADNAWATFWNPAGLAFQKGSELAMTHTNWLPGLGLSDIWIAHLAYKQPVEHFMESSQLN